MTIFYCRTWEGPESRQHALLRDPTLPEPLWFSPFLVFILVLKCSISSLGAGYGSNLAVCSLRCGLTTLAVGMVIKSRGHDSFHTHATVKGSQSKWSYTDIRLRPVLDSGYKAGIRPWLFTSSQRRVEIKNVGQVFFVQQRVHLTTGGILAGEERVWRL